MGGQEEEGLMNLITKRLQSTLFFLLFLLRLKYSVLFSVMLAASHTRQPLLSSVTAKSMHLHLLVSAQPRIIHLRQLARREEPHAQKRVSAAEGWLVGETSANEITSSRVQTLPELQTSRSTIVGSHR